MYFPILPIEVRQKKIEKIQQEIDKRWQKLKDIKKSFSLYKEKPDQEIIEEFNNLHTLREFLWFRNPNTFPQVSNEDYLVSQVLLEKGYYRTTNFAFAYNSTDDTYNSSTILFNDQHFIALEEPKKENLNSFFTLMLNHQVSILVRLKANEEYSDKSFNSIKYWLENNEVCSDSLTVKTMNGGEVSLPYFYTESWKDNDVITVEELYNLVKKIQDVYNTLEEKGPIACHCAGGVGRTGTLIAALILAKMLEQNNIEYISIEEMVLKLSIQRMNMVATDTQYLLLYHFIKYYLKQMDTSK